MPKYLAQCSSQLGHVHDVFSKWPLVSNKYYFILEIFSEIKCDRERDRTRSALSLVKVIKVIILIIMLSVQRTLISCKQYCLIFRVIDYWYRPLVLTLLSSFSKVIRLMGTNYFQSFIFAIMWTRAKLYRCV